MSSQENTSESSARAFGPEQWADLRSQADSFLQNLVVTVTPFSGLTSNALAHLRDNWIEWGDEFVIIRVPAEADCNQWRLKGTPNRPAMFERDEPCWYCRSKGTTGRFENLWCGSDGSESRRYTATLHRDIAGPAIDMLDKVFHDWGREGIHCAPNSVAKAAKRLLPGGNTHDYPKLLRTGVALYCHYGLDVPDIADLTPYTESTVKRILTSTPEVTQNQARKYNNSYAYLRAIAENEPATVKMIAQELDITMSPVRKALNRLSDRNRVEVNENSWPPTWSVIGNWADPFECEICGYQSPTIRGLTSHKQSHK